MGIAPVALSLLLAVRWYWVPQYSGTLPASTSRQGVYVCDLQVELPTIPVPALGETAYSIDSAKLWVYKGVVLGWVELAGGGGGAPTTATYITQTADAGLSAEQAMGLLGSGLVLNTTGTGVQSIYAGSTCGAGTKATATSAAGALTCSDVALGADVSGVLPLAKITDDAASGKCLLSGGAGDPAWTACPGGTGLSHDQTMTRVVVGF
jgi:hypothetical protein